jgi:hypothetical protein
MSAWVYAKSLPMQVYSTAAGEMRPIPLDECASLRTNTDSGEALFEIQRDSPR